MNRYALNSDADDLILERQQGYLSIIRDEMH